MSRVLRVAALLTLICTLAATGSPAAAATVSVYLPKQILSFDCPALRQGYSAALRSSYVRLECTVAPVAYAYGFRPPPARGNVMFHAELPGGAVDHARCGYLLTEISETAEGDGETYIALDCRGRP